MAASGFSERVKQWQAAGSMRVVDGRRIFVAGRTGRGPRVLFVHGFPSSSFDWRQTTALLDERGWIAPDLLGFGLSEKPHGRAYTIFEQADIVEQLVRGPEPVVLVAHDYGTTVATELLARDLNGQLGFPLQDVLLLNGSMVVERATLTRGQRLLRSPLGALAARLSSRRFFEREFARLFAPAQPLDSAEADDQWALWAHAGGNRNAHRLVAYLAERRTHAGRWHGAIARWPGDLRLIWGMLDPVATPSVLDALRTLRPAAPVDELPDVGHYVQIERPDLVAAAIELLAGPGAQPA